MNCNDDFKEWLNIVRFSRSVCMMIPMEACMGYPIVVKQGAEYILPFFKVVSSERVDRLSPPFAYLRVSYPKSAILTYNNLRTLSGWKEMKRDVIVEKRENYEVTSKIDDYYKAISCCENIGQNIEQQDELLLKCLYSQVIDNNDSSLLITWYKRLLDEARKYR